MGDPAAFVDRFQELFAVAYRASFAVLGDRHEAEDCAQDALAKALVRWSRVEDHAAAWVARVSTNAAIDRWRRRARVDPHDRDEPGDPIASMRADLVRALRAVPRRQREAVVLRHVLDLSERDTAAAMGCSTGTVKSATARGLDQLRLMLGPTWVLED